MRTEAGGLTVGTAGAGCVLAAAALVATLLAPPAAASQALAREHKCLNCHAAERKLVGPAFAEIARRYAGQPGAEAQLVQSIRAGAVRRWGPVPMPGHPKLSDDEARALARWSLAGGKP